MKDNVLSLKVVLANGEVMTTATRAKKSSSGYDLTRLIVGAEGTLGIITELTLRLSGIPETISGGVCPFPSVEAACKATIMTIQSGIPVARIELFDALQVRAANLYSKLNLPETPMLFLEFHGTEAGVAEQSRALWRNRAGIRRWSVRLGDPCRGSNAAVAGAPRRLLGAARPSSRRRGARVRRLCSDFAARRMPDRDAARYRREQILAPIVGHVGDGNFHVGLLVDRNDEQEVARIEAFLERLVDRALAMGGTCTGEHGVGQGKMKYLAAEHGEPALEAMRAIKRALDPLDIMNPGKIVNL